MSYLKWQNQEFLDTFLSPNLIKDREGLKPLLYYNAAKNTSLALPEKYLSALSKLHKFSRLLELPESAEREYFGCIVYAKPENFEYLSKLAGYSASKVPNLNDYYFNILKFNYLGEPRAVDCVPYALVSQKILNDEIKTEFYRYIHNKYGIVTEFVPVIRIINGKKQQFFEINFNLSPYYPEFNKENRDKIDKELYLSVLRKFHDFKEVRLLLADGQDFFSNQKNVEYVLSIMKTDSKVKFNKLLVEYAKYCGITNKVDGVLQNNAQIENICGTGYNWYDWYTDVIERDGKHRTSLVYIDTRENKYDLDLFQVVKQYFRESKLKIADFETPRRAYSVKGVMIPTASEFEFARLMPFINKKWQTLEMLDNGEHIRYVNYYGELRDCSRTPFVLLERQGRKAEIDELIKDLNDRYNYDFKFNPINRTIQGQPRQVAELSLDWYANADFNDGFISNFDKTIPILKNLEQQTALGCEKKDIKYYPIFANGQLK